LLAALLPVVAVLLQGCGNRRACKIGDIYALIQVDGRTGLTKHELEKAGVKLCARHLRKEETYADDACVDPEHVFVDGELPTPANGDSNALLLVRCPSTAYPKGKELQRVTCSDDYMGEMDDGTVEKALHLRFDNYERAANCLLGGNTTMELGSPNDNATIPKQVLTSENRKSKKDHGIKGSIEAMASKVMRAHGDHIALLESPASQSRGARAELLMAAAAVAELGGGDVQERAAALARELGPAVLSKAEADALLAKTDVSIHPHGTMSVHKHGSHHGHGHRKQHEEHMHLKQEASSKMHHETMFRAETSAPDHK